MKKIVSIVVFLFLLTFSFSQGKKINGFNNFVVFGSDDQIDQHDKGEGEDGEVDDNDIDNEDGIIHERRERLEAAREERKEAMEEIRNKRSQAKENASQYREEYRAKLSEIKDAKKQLILENIDERLGKVRDKWVEHWSKILNRLSEILAKAETRTNKLEEGGNDVVIVRGLIVDAKAAIEDAQEYLTLLSGSDYVIQISDEEGLGHDVKSIIAQFKEDLESTKEKVKIARDAVKEVVAGIRDVNVKEINDD